MTNLDIDWRSTGIDPSIYWRDVCELLVWEPYAVDHQHKPRWCGSARLDDVDRVEAVLMDLEHEHRDVVLDHEADVALGAQADLYLATKTRHRYVDATRRLGSRSWRPIGAMATSQLKARDRDGAVAVFRAADQPGHHQAHLQRRCLDLTGVDLGDIAGARA